MEDNIPISAYELEKQVDVNGEAIEKLEKRISDLEKSNINLGWKLGELEKELAEIRKPIIETKITKEIVQEWIAVLRKAEKDHLVELDHEDCGDMADMLERLLETRY